MDYMVNSGMVLFHLNQGIPEDFGNLESVYLLFGDILVSGDWIQRVVVQALEVRQVQEWGNFQVLAVLVCVEVVAQV